MPTTFVCVSRLDLVKMFVPYKIDLDIIGDKFALIVMDGDECG